MGYNQSIDSSYMFMPSYNFGMYGLNNPAAYNYCAYTNPSIYSGGFNPMLGYNNYMTPTLPFTFNGLSSTTSNKTVPTLAGTDLSTISHKGASAEPAATTPDLPAEEPEKKEGRSVWGKIGIGLLVTAVVVGLGLGADHLWNGGKCRKAIGDWFKNLGKVKPESEKPTTPTETPTAGNTAPSKFKDMSKEDIAKYLETADKTKGEYCEALEQLFAKSNKIDDGKKLIEYYDELIPKFGYENPNLNETKSLPEDLISILTKKKRLCEEMSAMYRQSGEIDNAISMLVECNKIHQNMQRMHEITYLNMLKDNSQELLKYLRDNLEKGTNPFPYERADGGDICYRTAECLKVVGENDLSKSIKLLLLGRGGLDKLSQEEIIFLKNQNIDYEKICNATDKTLMNNWVLEQLDKVIK